MSELRLKWLNSVVQMWCKIQKKIANLWFSRICDWKIYPKDYLFSNQFMEDLGRIYSLRKYFPSFDDMKKTEVWDSQPFGSVFASTSDTPISSVVTADFLYLTKANSYVRSHFDKHRVNHLDSHPDLSAMISVTKVRTLSISPRLSKRISPPPQCSGQREFVIPLFRLSLPPPEGLYGIIEPSNSPFYSCRRDNLGRL